MAGFKNRVAGDTAPFEAIVAMGFAAAINKAVLVVGDVAALNAWASAAQREAGAVVGLEREALAEVEVGVLRLPMDAAPDARQRSDGAAVVLALDELFLGHGRPCGGRAHDHDAGARHAGSRSSATGHGLLDLNGLRVSAMDAPPARNPADP